MGRLSIADVRALAPDAKAFAAGQTLARPGPWSGVGAADGVLWGRCQGSGSTPYQVSIDLGGPTVTCTCPSRKTPCKHGIALLLLRAKGEDAFDAAGTPPDTAALQARRRALDAAGPATTTVADPQAQARRLAKRLTLMTDGLAELDRWLVDVVADGLASVRSRPYAWWDGVASRLVDAQVPGIADRIRAMPGRLAGNDDWASDLLIEISRWSLAVRAWQDRDRLDAADMAELRTYLGWTRTTEEVLAGQRERGEWTVVGVATSEQGRVTEQRTWLWHDRLGFASIMDFGVGGSPVGTPQLVGARLDAEMAIYPGRPPQRLRILGDPVPLGHADDLPAATVGWQRTLADVAELATTAPWQDRFPAIVAGVRLVDVDDRPRLVDAQGHALDAVDIAGWSALALTGGHPVTVFGEVRASAFRPLTVQTAHGIAALPPLAVPTTDEGGVPF